MILEQIMVGRRAYVRCCCDSCGEGFRRRNDHIDFQHCKACANKRGAEKRSTHGLNNKNSRLHVTWNNMLQRVRNPKNRKFPIYGGAGVKVCDAWSSFPAFMDWSMANGYRDDLTLDRIDPAGDYEPSNCRYVEHSTQNANRRQNLRSKTGFLGVAPSGKHFRSYVNWNRKRIELGRFNTPEAAAHARDEYIKKMGLPHLLNGAANDEAADEAKTNELLRQQRMAA